MKLEIIDLGDEETIDSLSNKLFALTLLARCNRQNFDLIRELSRHQKRLESLGVEIVTGC